MSRRHVTYATLGILVAAGLLAVLLAWPQHFAFWTLVVAFVGVLWGYRGSLTAESLRQSVRWRSYPWELVLLPLAVSVRQELVVTVALLVGTLAVVIVRPSRKRHLRLGSLIPLGLLALASLVTDRFAESLIAITGLTVAVVVVSAFKTPLRQAMTALGAGLSVYLIANVIGHFLGIASPVAEVRIGGFETSTIGFDERILFPFVRSINSATIVFMVLLGILAGNWMLRIRVDIVAALGLIAGVYVAWGSNSRAAIVIGVGLVLVVMLASGLARRVLPWAVPITMALPFYLPLAMPLIRFASDGLALVGPLSRGQTADQIAELGTRGPIWLGTLRFWQEQADVSGRLVGWGPDGHAASGANAYYLQGQDGFLSKPEALTTHNSLLQTLMDGGLIALALYVVGLVWLLVVCARSVEGLPSLLAVSAIGLTGLLEVTASPAPTMTPFLLLLALAAYLPSPDGLDSNAAPDTPRGLVNWRRTWEQAQAAVGRPARTAADTR